MKILIPSPPKDSSRPQWWILSMDIHRRPAIGWVVDILVRVKWFAVQIRCNATVDILASPVFIRPSRFTSVYIVHPNGGGAQRLKCEECGAEYPFPVTGRAFPCGFCAIERESVVKVWWRRATRLVEGSPLYERMRQWPSEVNR